MTLLSVQNLFVEFDVPDGTVQAVRDLSFHIDKSDTLAIVGESGSGKTQSVFAIMGLLANNGSASGTVMFGGRNILNAPEEVLNQVRAQEIAMIFQDPMTSFNPYLRISDQMAEVLTHHKGMSKSDAMSEVIRMLDAVKIPDAKNRVSMYPHEFSGGMLQRALIAMSLLCRPKLLIADEPTTALDVTVQAQIMSLLSELQREFHMAIILITHDLGVVAGSCRETLVLYAGQVVEFGSTDDIFECPSHPYTKGLIHAVPRLDRNDELLATIPGDPPNMMRLAEGCPFSPRCSYVLEHCKTSNPPLVATGEGIGLRACHRSVEELV